MKYPFIGVLLLFSLPSFAKVDTATHGTVHCICPSVCTYYPFPYFKNSITLTAAVGFADQFRTGLKLPPGFENNSTSGNIPVYLRGEYGVTKDISVGASFAYDAFNDNYDQLFYGNGTTYRRFSTDNIRVLSAAGIGYFHFGRYLHLKNIDLFAGIGLSLNNIRHSNAPQPDSVPTTVLDHTATLYLKAGGRYYINRNTSLFAEAGFDMHSIVAAGLSYRFGKTRYKPNICILKEAPEPEPPIITDTTAVISVPIVLPPSPPPAPKPEPAKKIDMSTPVLFDINKTDIKEESIPILEEAAREMKESSDAVVIIDAYTDITGSKAYNLTLSVRRANAVKNRLVQLGADPQHIKAIGHGINDPVETNDTPEGRAKNRRVVMKLKHNK